MFLALIVSTLAASAALPPPTDLDGDGKPETFVLEGESLRVGKSKVACGVESFPCEVEVHDITANDGKRELAVCNSGPRDDGNCDLYRYDNGALVAIPMKHSSGEQLWVSAISTKGNGIVLADQQGRFYTRRDKLVDQGGKLAFIAQPVYNTGGVKVPVDRSFPITLRPDGGDVVANVAPGTTVTLLAADGAQPDTFLVLVSSGLVGWANINTIAKGSDQVMQTLGAG